jgi:hypothetical protein
LRERCLFDRCDGGGGDFDRRWRHDFGFGSGRGDILDFDFGHGSGRDGLLDRFLGNDFGFRRRKFFGNDRGCGRWSRGWCLRIQEATKVTAKLGKRKRPKRGDARIVCELRKDGASD